MDNKHTDELHANSTVCMADFCDVLNCEISLPIACHEAEMSRRRHRCRALFDRCFPMEADARLHDSFLHSFCDKVGRYRMPLVSTPCDLFAFFFAPSGKGGLL